jgi:soluble lytic murein transglycosylase
METIFTTGCHYRFIFLSLLLTTAVANADQPWQEPTQAVHHDSFFAAKNALAAGDFALFQILFDSLKTYPLAYYLRYLQLKAQMTEVPSHEISQFLQQHRYSSFAQDLRRDWLFYLAEQNQWQQFLTDYVPQPHVGLQCLAQYAQIQTHGADNTTLNEAIKLWKVGKSQPNHCDPLFNYLYARHHINDDLLWQRIALVMDSKTPQLAKALLPNFSDPQLQNLAQLWLAVHDNPNSLLTLIADDTPKMRQIMIDGLKQQSKSDINTAYQTWLQWANRYGFSPTENQQIQQNFALSALQQDLPNTKQWQDAIKNQSRSLALAQMQTQWAFKHQDWSMLLDAIQALPPEEKDQLRWQYWQARALNHTSQTAQAQNLFKSLAKQRDYYGFLAADHLSVEYKLAEKPVAYQKQDLQKLLTDHPEFFYVKEFHAVGLGDLAKREWWALMEKLSSRERALAAVQARQWEWYNYGIYAAHKANVYDDLNIRFPMPFYQKISANANDQALSPSWVYGIIRQESAFSTVIASHVGAMGLMQLMPATGQAVAEQIGLELDNPEAIYQIDNNLRLGTAYLRQMLDQFDDNPLLASAAYNAGPGRVKRWLQQRPCLPTDVWVELIPFKETRNYVRNVLMYSNIFNLRLNEKNPDLRLAAMKINHCSD